MENIQRIIETSKIQQRSDEWFKIRQDKISASRVASLLGKNKYQSIWNFVVEESQKSKSYSANVATHHGTNFEALATLMYEKMQNCSVIEVGCVQHPFHELLIASPDGLIVNKENPEESKLLEIKCPKNRKIRYSSNKNDILDICPVYYYHQIQMQLECCQLNTCDFWQCEVFLESEKKWKSFTSDQCKVSFNKDQNSSCLSYSSPINHLIYKGQGFFLEPKAYKDDSEKQLQVVYVFPNAILEPKEHEVWKQNFLKNYAAQNYAALHSTLPASFAFDQFQIKGPLFWVLKKAHLTTIFREKDWIKRNIQIINQVWKFVMSLKADQPLRQELIELYGKQLLHEDFQSIEQKFTVLKQLTACMPQVQPAEIEQQVQPAEIEPQVQPAEIELQVQPAEIEEQVQGGEQVAGKMDQETQTEDLAQYSHAAE